MVRDMGKRVAVVTGASSGMGRRFACTASDYVSYDELWIIARRRDRLEEVASGLPGRKVVPIDADLTSRDAVASIERRILEEKAEIVLLVNAAGFGISQAMTDIDIEVADSMLELNCRALLDMCHICVPHMRRGAMILNIASVAAFQPIPCFAEYGATKAFVLSFSRALWKELRPLGITVTALCPFWTRTEFFDVACSDREKNRVSNFIVMYEADDVVRQGWKDLLHGRDISLYGAVSRLQRALVWLLPHRLVMSIWCRQQGIE